MAQVDHLEVGRVVHELSHRHGQNAHNYASKLAAEALADGMVEEYEFWKWVEIYLKPRRK